MSFSEKKIELTIKLGTGNYGEQVGDTVTLSGYRMMADIVIAGGETMGMAQVRIWGLSQEIMNRLSIIGYVNGEIRYQNSILIAAGDDNGMHVAYEGTIDEAWADYNEAPNVSFNIIAHAGLVAALKPVGATSFRGAVQVSEIMQTLAQMVGLTLDNRGVNVTLSNPYFPGSTLDQIRACAQAADCWYTIEKSNLIIYPKANPQHGSPILISKETGMIGYPTYAAYGVHVVSEYNPALQFPCAVEVQSDLGPNASGTFYVTSLVHNLSCNMPNGPWFSTIDTCTVGYGN